MDRGAWWVTVRGITELDTTEHTACIVTVSHVTTSLQRHHIERLHNISLCQFIIVYFTKGS